MMTSEEVDVDASIASIHLNDRSDLPSIIDPSMVAAWSQLMDYEPSLPQLSGATATPLRPRSDLSSTQLSEIRSRESMLSASSGSGELDRTNLSHLQSVCVDGTATQLLVESYCDRLRKRLEPQQQQQNPSNSLLLSSFSSVNNYNRRMITAATEGTSLHDNLQVSSPESSSVSSSGFPVGSPSVCNAAAPAGAPRRGAEISQGTKNALVPLNHCFVEGPPIR